MNFYNCKNKKVFKFNIENEIKDIFCGNKFILLKCIYNKIFVINEFGIHKLKYYNKNGFFKIDNLCVRYNEIFILLNSLKGEQLLLRYSPSNENNILNINYEYYERLYKINLKKKIKLIYSTSSYFINGIFFEIECDEKERIYLESNKDKLFTLINRDFKDKKILFEKIKDLNEEEKNELINMKNNNENNNWNGIKRNYSSESKKLIENLKKRNRNFSIEKFFENSPLSDKNIGFLTSRNLSHNKFLDNDSSEDEIEKRKKRKEYLKHIKNMSKKIEEDEIERLKREKYDKLRKKLENDELLRKKLEEEELRKKLEEEKLKRKKEEEEELKRKKKEEEELKKKKIEEELKRKKEEEEELLRKKLSDDLKNKNKLNLNNISKLRNSKFSNLNKTNTTQINSNKKNKLMNNISKNIKLKTNSKNKKPIKKELTFNGRKIIKLKNKNELISMLNDPNSKNDESIYYYIENNKENMDDLLSEKDYFNYNGLKLIKVKGGKIIKNFKNRISSLKIKNIFKSDKKNKKKNSDIINKYFNNKSISNRNFSDSSILEKGRNLSNTTRAFVEIIPTERKIKKKLKMKLISEIKNFEKIHNELDLNLLTSREKRIKSFAITDENALKDFKEKIDKVNRHLKGRNSMPNIILKVNKSENEESKEYNNNYENEYTKSKFSNTNFNYNNDEDFEVVNIKTFDNNN